ncbi:MAG: heme oxygenase [Flavobacteriales bacterium]|nr:MAG: heme oxygenase [Flavobacteriales bacterium]
MLSTKIKDATKEAHQHLEKQVILKLKAIRSNADYADVLKHFYAYFNAVEKAIEPYITTSVLPDYAERRNSSYIKADIEELGGSINELPEAKAPEINNLQQALGALYVMEGSIMGGSIIVQMLAKYGVEKGVSFFSGYGAQTGEMWAKFTAALNSNAQDEIQENEAIDAANQTFANFADVFESASVL